MDENQNANTEERHKVALEADNRENKRILQNFSYGEVKGDHLDVNIKTHRDINDGDKDIHPKEYAVQKAAVLA